MELLDSLYLRFQSLTICLRFEGIISLPNNNRTGRGHRRNHTQLLAPLAPGVRVLVAPGVRVPLRDFPSLFTFPSRFHSNITSWVEGDRG